MSLPKEIDIKIAKNVFKERIENSTFLKSLKGITSLSIFDILGISFLFRYFSGVKKFEPIIIRFNVIEKANDRKVILIDYRLNEIGGTYTEFFSYKDFIAQYKILLRESKLNNIFNV